MKRPARSRFMGLQYTITAHPQGTVLGDDGEVCNGTTDFAKHAIAIEDGLAHDIERDTAIHEVLHQMFYTANVGLDGELEEKICTFLGSALIGHMRDNPSFWRYLMQKPPKERQA